MRMINIVDLKKINLTKLFAVTIPIFIIALYWFRFSANIEFIIFSIATFIYLIMALIHHFREKTFILEIVIEYILIAILALVVIQSLIL
jgi:hypothetical protein